MKTIKKLWIGIGILAVVSPVGLIFPDMFKAGSAWGEWGTDEINGLVGYIPGGLEKLSSIWSALLPDYAFQGWEQKGLGQLSFAYIISAIVGIVVCIGVTYFFSKLLVKKES